MREISFRSFVTLRFQNWWPVLDSVIKLVFFATLWTDGPYTVEKKLLQFPMYFPYLMYHPEWPSRKPILWKIHFNAHTCRKTKNLRHELHQLDFPQCIANYVTIARRDSTWKWLCVFVRLASSARERFYFLGGGFKKFGVSILYIFAPLLGARDRLLLFGLAAVWTSGRSVSKSQRVKMSPSRRPGDFLLNASQLYMDTCPGVSRYLM